MKKVLGALLLLSISTAAKVAESTSETYSITPDSYLTAVYRAVTGVTGDLQCGGICLTAEPHFCVAYSYCHINRTYLLSEHLPASANGLSDSNCRIYKITGLRKTFPRCLIFPSTFTAAC